MEKLAEAIKLAAKIREESYDNEKAEKLRQQSGMYAIVDFSTCYTKTLYQAADEAAANVGFDERGTLPIYILLKNNLNDILDWAEQFD